MHEIDTLNRWQRHEQRPPIRYVLREDKDGFSAVVWSGIRSLGQGVGRSKQAAKTAAATDALSRIKRNIGSSSRGKVAEPKRRVPQKDRQRRYAQRRTERGSILGRQFEKRVLGILEVMVEEGLLHSFEYHIPFSSADLSGKDFTVRRGETEISFGVTISHRRLKQYPSRDVPQFWFPWNTSPHAIRQRIIELFG